jgi:hypothetical protein
MPLLGDVFIEKVRKKSRPLSEYKKGLSITAKTPMNPFHKQYTYILQENPGMISDAEFKPALTPAEILALGAFEGKYINDNIDEFPAEWYLHAAMLGKLSSDPDPSINFFQMKSRQPLSVWKKNGWTTSKSGKGILGSDQNPDERGWFQWYCRYWLGRRIPELDRVQIARWKSFNRHAGQIRANCKPGDLTCRPKQRMGLLQWAYVYDI